MKYDRFDDLPVWQSAIQLAAGVYALTEEQEFQKRYSLRDQIERAAVSVSNNIAEGFERSTNQELLAFLYIARGSAGEVRSMLLPARTDSSLRPSRTGPDEAEIEGREYFEAARRLDSVIAGLGHERRALCERADAAG